MNDRCAPAAERPCFHDTELAKSDQLSIGKRNEQTKSMFNWKGNKIIATTRITAFACTLFSTKTKDHSRYLLCWKLNSFALYSTTNSDYTHKQAFALQQNLKTNLYLIFFDIVLSVLFCSI